MSLGRSPTCLAGSKDMQRAEAGAVNWLLRDFGKVAGRDKIMGLSFLWKHFRVRG